VLLPAVAVRLAVEPFVVPVEAVVAVVSGAGFEVAPVVVVAVVLPASPVEGLLLSQPATTNRTAIIQGVIFIEYLIIDDFESF